MKNLLPGGSFAEKCVVFVATGFSTGIAAPFASGTFGSIPGVALAYAFCALHFSMPLQIAIAAVLTLMAIPVCTIAEKVFAKKDDGRIVADEWMLYPIAVAGLPLLSFQSPLWCVAWGALFFCVIRFFDIVKFPPCRKIQILPGGWGVVLDDLIANVYSLGANWALYLVAKHFHIMGA